MSTVGGTEPTSERPSAELPLPVPASASSALAGGDPRASSQNLLLRDLNSFRVREILLVSSAYDSYVIQEDAFLGESLDAEYHQLNLSAAPRITQVSTAEQALQCLGERRFDLVITMPRVGEMQVPQLGRAIKARYPELAVVLLAYSPSEAARIKSTDHQGAVDQVFIWRGDVRIFLAIIKYIEDGQNARRDTDLVGVRTILLIENSVRFYSSYLPLLYTELMRQIQALMADGVNAMQRLRRMRARPKVLLAETYESGEALLRAYGPTMLGVITDVRFPRNGRSDPEAGLAFLRLVRASDPDMPVLVQSAEAGVAEAAQSLGARFLNKRSPHLLDEVRRFLLEELGFGDFVFRGSEGEPVERVSDIGAMTAALVRVPDESILYHATRNHFSNWCTARTEFDLARRLRPVKVEEFPNVESLRRYLVDAFSRLRTDSQKGVVAEFERLEPGASQFFARIGSGSMGGKGRGLGFINSYMPELERIGEDTGARVFIPPSVVLGTDVFDDFVRMNSLAGIALGDAADAEICEAFLRGRFPAGVEKDLAHFADVMRFPLAVRSSSLLEDSHDQPFAGIYKTFMLANNDSSTAIRLAEIERAVKLVYASTFSKNAKAYLLGTPHRMEEERMGVVLQRLVGQVHGRYFYPDFSGVACSYNFYPVLDCVAEEGMVLTALGLGKTVVDGERAVRWIPTRPRFLPQFSSTSDYLENAQRWFYALDLDHEGRTEACGGEENLVRLGLEAAEQHGTLGPLASVYSAENDAVYEGLSRQGVRLVTFAPMLKNAEAVLPRTVERLLQLGTRIFSCPVEIEFACNSLGPRERLDVGFLQIRPMTVETHATDIEEMLAATGADPPLCVSSRALGRGRNRDVADVVYVRPDRFDRAVTRAIASEVEALNRAIAAEGRGYVLIGPGRWGTSDPWLGVPVEWHQISAARAIVETDLGDVPVTPSEGTHFFQNLTSFGIGYFTVYGGDPGGHLDVGWLESRPAAYEGTWLRHVRLPAALEIAVDGRSRRGVILKGPCAASSG